MNDKIHILFQKIKSLLKSNKMLVSGVDADISEIVNYLNNMGLKPYASCDGKLEHHEYNENIATKAYIAFLETTKIKDIVAVLKNYPEFTVSIGSQTEFEPYELYGNMIKGTTFSIDFNNLYGENMNRFSAIIKDIVKGKVRPSKKDRKEVNDVSNIIMSFNESDIITRFSYNQEYQPYMSKNGKTNLLAMSWSRDSEPRDMRELAEVISKNLGIDNREAYTYKYDSYPDNFVLANEWDCGVYHDDAKILLNIMRDTFKKYAKVGENRIRCEKPFEDCYGIATENEERKNRLVNSIRNGGKVYSPRRDEVRHEYKRNITMVR